MVDWGWPGLFLTLAGWAMLWRGDRKSGRPEPGLSSKWKAATALGLFALALALRFYRLDGHPPFWWDEGVQAYDVRSLMAGIPLEPLEGIRYHRSPLWMAILAGFSFLFGHSVTALRSSGALTGALVPVFSFYLVMRLFGTRAGILSGLFLAWHPWLLHQSRMSHGSILTPVMALVILLVATDKRFSMRWRALLVGLVAGVNVYGYAASYQLPFLGALALLVVPSQKSSWRTRGEAVMLIMLISVAFALPATLLMPDYWGKTWDVSAGGKPGLLWQNIIGGLRLFHIEGDADMRHWYPAGGAVLSPFLGPLFSLGIGLVLAGRIGWAGWLALGWLVLGLSPGLVTSGGDRNLFRMIGGAPPTAVICTLGALGILRTLGGKVGITAVILMWLASGWIDLRTYFVAYAKDPAISSVYRNYADEAGKDIREAVRGGVKTICPPLTVVRHPLEKLYLFDAMVAGRVSMVTGPCGQRGAKKVFRDSFGQPQAVIFRSGSHLEYRTMMDICMEGDAMLADNQAGEAGVFCRSWLAVFPDSYALMERVGFADLKAGKSHQAVRDFREAVGRGSNMASTWDGLAAALFETGQFEEAEKALERALQLEPGNNEIQEDMETVKQAVRLQKQGGN